MSNFLTVENTKVKPAYRRKIDSFQGRKKHVGERQKIKKQEIIEKPQKDRKVKNWKH